MRRPRLWPARATAFAAVAVYIAIHCLRPGGREMLEITSGILDGAVAIITAALCFAASARFEPSVPQRRVWYLLGIGMALWAIAEFLWAYFQIGLGDDVPYPSPADVVWAIGYIPLILGLVQGHRSLAVRLTPRQRIAAVSGYGVLLTALTVTLLVPMFAHSSAGSAAEAAVGVYYLIGDLTLAFVVTLTAIVLWRGLVGRPWLSIVIGMFLFAVSDTVFSYAAWVGLYGVGDNLLSLAIDVSYFAAYVSVALGAYRQGTLRLADIAAPA